MITNCPVCGKAFDVLWADLWRYRRAGRYLCSYGCLRQVDEGENEMNQFTKEQKEEAIRIALEGGDPKAYLKSIGSSAPDKLWYYMKTQLLKKDPETYEKLAGSRKRADDPPESEFTPAAKAEPEEKPVERQKPPYYGQPIPGFEDEPEKVEVVPETPFRFIATTMEYKTTGISTPIGDWQYFKRSGYLDWTPLDGNGTVSMNLEEWKELMKLFPEVLKVLGVRLDV